MKRLLTPLAWDSEMLGLKVARFAPTRVVRADLNRVRTMCRKDAIDMVYFFLPSSSATNALAEEFRLGHVCSRITYEKKLGVRGVTDTVPAGCDIRIIVNPSTRSLGGDFLRKISYTIGQTSRFFRDHRLAPASAWRLYAAWVRNSFEGRCDVNLVAMSGRRPVGWLGLKMDGHDAIIDLVGVLPKFQGSGVGAMLGYVAEKTAECLGAKRMAVVTESETIGAQRYYQRRGFAVCEHQLVYHYWPKKI